MIGSLIFWKFIFPFAIVPAIILALILIFLRKTLKKVLPWIAPVVFLYCIYTCVFLPWMQKRIREENFKSFNLSELLREELIIQTINFNKFVVFGTEENAGSILDDLFFKYEDELKVYHIEGRAEVIFREINKLRAVEEDFDYEKGICAFSYDSPDYKNAFTVKVYIENIEVVQDFESEKFLGLDLKRPDQTQSQIIEKTKEKLEKEFVNQITKGITKKNIANSDVYKTFILSLEKMVEPFGWQSVRVAFENNSVDSFDQQLSLQSIRVAFENNSEQCYE